MFVPSGSFSVSLTHMFIHPKLLKWFKTIHKKDMAALYDEQLVYIAHLFDKKYLDKRLSYDFVST